MPLLRKTVQAGELSAEIEKSGSFLSTHYKKMKVYSPLWNRGTIVGGIQMEIPMWDLMTNLLESRKILLITIISDALVLIGLWEFFYCPVCWSTL